MRSQSADTRHIVLVLNAGLTFHREIIAGIGAFSQAAGLRWEFEVAVDVRKVLMADPHVDGVIADASACAGPDLCALAQAHPLVCVSSAVTCDCPAGVSVIASDNDALIDVAVRHLRDTGIIHFAYYAKPKYLGQAWAQERREAFLRRIPHPAGVLCEQDEAGGGAVHAGRLAAWLHDLPPRTGVVAVNDSSAREVLHACATARREVPDDVSIVGIDNDPLVAALAPLPISSVMQGTHEMGRKAAELLHARMRNRRYATVRIAVPPKGILLVATSRKTSPQLRDALEYIGKRVGHGIKAEQVADHLGMSRTTLERLFQEHLGHSVHDELLRTRLERAKQLLMSRAVTTAEVARRCGFRTQQYMHVVFRRELGLSPSEFVAQSIAHE